MRPEHFTWAKSTILALTLSSWPYLPCPEFWPGKSAPGTENETPRALRGPGNTDQEKSVKL